MRICAVHLPELRVELLRAMPSPTPGPAPGPLGIVVAAPPLTEAKLLGNMRLDVVSREARLRGATTGQTIAQARARVPDMTVRVMRPADVRQALASLAEAALAFGATVSFRASGDDGDSLGDMIWVDITGCAHLHAPEMGKGERILASRLQNLFAELGHVCAVAVADGPRMAAIFARRLWLAQSEGRLTEDDRPRIGVVPPGRNAATVAPLPLSALPLREEDLRWLTKIGVRTVGELRELPRTALGPRLGTRAPAVLALAEGDDRAPLDPYVPPRIPEERVELEYGVESTDALLFVAKTLTDRLAARLGGRAVRASRLELCLELDRAMFSDRLSDPDEDVRELLAIDLPEPLSAAADLLAVLRPKIERFVLRAPVLAATLRAPNTAHTSHVALSLFEAEPRATHALPRLAAELVADLGEDAVGKLVVGDSWLPEERSRFVPLSDRSARSRPSRKARHLLSSVPEPTRILSTPIPVPRERVKIERRLTRLEAVAWWKCMPGTKTSADYVYAWVDDAPAWVELDRATGEATLRGWFD